MRRCWIAGQSGLTELKAFVVVGASGAEDQALARELGDMVRNRWPMQEYKRVGTVEFISALPRTKAGKLDRSKLRPESSRILLQVLSGYIKLEDEVHACEVE